MKPNAFQSCHSRHATTDTNSRIRVGMMKRYLSPAGFVLFTGF
ncbi:MAG: hypothetical protein P1U68_17615 [Verrucomicrobiales bacterium]|nr:hypothetical protein [Verrucomicrobiales bacterium]